VKDEEFGEIPQETLRWFAEAGREKVLATGPAVWGLMGDVLNLRFLQLLQPHFRSLVKAGIAAEKGSPCSRV
jgi:hypothetical protein